MLVIYHNMERWLNGHALRHSTMRRTYTRIMLAFEGLRVRVSNGISQVAGRWRSFDWCCAGKSRCRWNPGHSHREVRFLGMQKVLECHEVRSGLSAVSFAHIIKRAAWSEHGTIAEQHEILLLSCRIRSDMEEVSKASGRDGNDELGRLFSLY